MTSLQAVDPSASRLGPHLRLERVLYAYRLDPSQKYGSLEEQIFELARAMRARGGFLLPLFIAPMSREAAARYERAGLRAEVLDLVRFELKTLRRLVSLIRREQIDLVHWSFYEPLINPYLWCLSVVMPGLRHRYTEHNSRPDPVAGAPRGGPKEWVKRTLMRRYERIYGISDFVLLAHQTHYPARKAARWRYFVNTDRFAPDAAARVNLRTRMGIADHQFVIVVIANLIRQKGVDVAIRALARRPVETVLWVVGSGEQQESLRGLARELGLADRVRFLGMCHDVAPFIQAADCLCCPSVWGEAVGLVNLAGMSCGTPVVASAVGGIPEFLRDGETGLLVPPGDVEALADAFRRLADDPSLRATLGRNAREAALREHSLASQIEGQIAEYLQRNWS